MPLLDSLNIFCLNYVSRHSSEDVSFLCIAAVCCSWSFIVEFIVLCKVEETFVICISSHSAESTLPIVDLFVSSSYL